MDDTVCPRCRTSKFQNPSMKMLVNVCGHGLCESCVDLLFLKGSGSCPECKIPLRRSNFRVQLFEDAMVEKEIDIRKRILRDYNKKEEDFETLKGFNDYLEEVETIVYNLTNDIDIIQTNKRIDQYKKENREMIIKNKQKLGREEYELEELLEMEKEQELLRKQDMKAEELELKRKKIREKEALIDELMFSSADANNIVSTFAQSAKELQLLPPPPPPPPPPKRSSQFSSGIQFGRGSVLAAPPPLPVEEGPLYVYRVAEEAGEGPALPEWAELEGRGYVRHVRAETEAERAGGFRATLACMRALQDALAGLYHIHALPG